MKKSLIPTVIAGIISFAFLTSCGAKASKNLELPSINIQPVTTNTECFDIVNEPAAELFFIACHLANIDGFNNQSWSTEKYISSVEMMFEKYKDEPLVKTLKTLAKNKFDVNDLVEFVYYIKPDFSGINCDLNNLPQSFSETFRKIKPSTLEKIVVQLNDFAGKTGFERFYLMNKSNYLNYISTIKNMIEHDEPEANTNMETWFKEFYRGYEIEKIKINCSCMLNGYNYFNTNTFSDGSVHNILSLSAYNYKMAPVYFGNYIYAEKLLNKVWPEIKDNAEAFMTKFKIKNNITYDLDTRMQISCLLGDCLTSDYVEKNWNTEEKTAYVDMLTKNYMVEEIPVLIEVVEDYSKNAEKYQSFEMIIPELLTASEKILK